ncbi:MAG: DUF4925 domain-containing protein [Muribaculaceae bacterium]|nr:DUF4925 domain-containing protein [Muribaculaceae bacterium]
MKTRIFTLVIFSLLLSIGVGSCSKNEFNPEDYATSWLTGEYGKNQLWKLNVTVNGEPTEDYDYVRFESGLLVTGKFRFVNVIPGEKRKEFKDIPLTGTEEGVLFTIEYEKNHKPVTIKGTVTLGEMTVDITM